MQADYLALCNQEGETHDRGIAEWVLGQKKGKELGCKVTVVGSNPAVSNPVRGMALLVRFRVGRGLHEIGHALSHQIKEIREVVMKRIEIEYFEDGSTKVEAFGFEGASCIEATKEIEERHGTVQTIEHKPEFYETGVLCDATKLCG